MNQRRPGENPIGEEKPMVRPIFIGLLALVVVVAIGATLSRTSSAAVKIPSPAVDDQLASAKGQQTIVLSGGCFWGIQAVFEHVKGVTKATAGYSGGAANTAQYEAVSEGRSGHAESVEVIFDPSQISVGQLLKVFFSVAHDPTELNRQGPDEGTQYRSVIFYSNENQKHIAQAYVAQLDQAKVFRHAIVTQIVPLVAFYAAEGYHQDYAVKNPNDAYIVFNDLPKVEHLRQEFPELYKNYK
jgi:peptide-methionine (S)-S-oxide reductase